MVAGYLMGPPVRHALRSHTMASMKERAVSRGWTAECADHRRVGSLAAGTKRWSIWPGIYSSVFMVVMRPGAAQSKSRPSGEAMPYGERALVERGNPARGAPGSRPMAALTPNRDVAQVCEPWRALSVKPACREIYVY